MSIVLNGTTGITTPDIDSTAGFDAADLTGALPAISGAALTNLPIQTVSLANATDCIISTVDPAENTNPSTGSGTMWVNKTTGNIYILKDATQNANIWENAGAGQGRIGGFSAYTATGGIVTTSGNFRIHTFTSSGTFAITDLGDVTTASFLCVAGGGGGGTNDGGGGGAGGYLTGNITTFAAANYTITVGAGGTFQTSVSDSSGNGGNSSISGSGVSYTSIGGGMGTGESGAHANSGGSGGGGATNYGNGGAGTAGQGNNGADGGDRGGGGGGAGAATTTRVGGVGLANSITGTSIFYAGGGGGGDRSGGGAGGAGGGGNGSGGAAPGSTAGQANTGGGGGGSDGNYMGPKNGGSGVVIISYQFQT